MGYYSDIRIECGATAFKSFKAILDNHPEVYATTSSYFNHRWFGIEIDQIKFYSCTFHDEMCAAMNALDDVDTETEENEYHFYRKGEDSTDCEEMYNYWYSVLSGMYSFEIVKGERWVEDVCDS